ncbi:MAG: hypothetical protein DMF43_03855 [Verrucomicrobia bacterium]|nr:MAG: hypothetical protein DMF43_03855 [Verrucomicrobiota bacterium]
MPIRHLALNVEPLRPATSTERQTLFRALINSAIGVGAFLLTCIGLHAVLPFPQIDGVSQKLRFFAAHKDEFDTLFIGSSRIYFQISPAIFDGVIRESGSPMRSFNFGIGGMHLPESAYVLEQVLNTKPRNLRWVFIELGELQTKWPHEAAGSRRALYWHDWRRTSLILRKVLGSGTHMVWLPNLKKVRDIILPRKSGLETRDLFIFHMAELEKNFANVATGSDILDYFSRRDINKDSAKYLGAAGDGYVPMTNKGMSASQTATYEHALALVMAQNGWRSISPYTMEACRQCAQKIRGIGAVPIFLITPSTTRFNVTYLDNARPPGVVMAFNDPRVYPNLYRSSVRLDEDHLTKEGAEEFTRIMAANFMHLVQAGEIK